MNTMDEDIYNDNHIPQNMMDHIHQLDEVIPLSLQNNYFRQSLLIRRSRFELNDEYIQVAKDAFDNYETEDPAKLMDYLSHLAVGGRIDAYRIIESFKPTTPDTLKQWASMAQLEARIEVVSFLVDEKQIAITSGLGGHDGLMRMEAIIYTNQLQELKPFESKLLKDEFELIVGEQKGEIELIEEGMGYVKLRFLLPLRKEINNLFNIFISRCNIYGGFLSPHFYVTNTEPITDEEITKLLDKYRRKHLEANHK